MRAALGPAPALGLALGPAPAASGLAAASLGEALR